MSVELYTLWNEAQETLGDVIALKAMLEKIVSDGNFGTLTDTDINRVLNRAQLAIAWFTNFASQRNFMKNVDFIHYSTFAMTSGAGVVYLCLMDAENVSNWVHYIYTLGSLLYPIQRNISVSDFENALTTFQTDLNESYVRSILPSYHIAKAMTYHYSPII